METVESLTGCPGFYKDVGYIKVEVTALGDTLGLPPPVVLLLIYFILS